MEMCMLLPVRRSLLTGLMFVSVGAVSGIAATAPAPVTFTKDVAPIFYKNCVVCHYPKPAGKDEGEAAARVTNKNIATMTKNPHGGAPMSLFDYATAKA